MKKKTTAETITKAEIRAVRYSAAAEGNFELLAISMRAEGWGRETFEERSAAIWESDPRASWTYVELALLTPLYLARCKCVSKLAAIQRAALEEKP